MSLQVLEELIKHRWGAIDDQQREGIKNYLSNLIIKISSDEASLRREKVFLNKLNILLVQVGAASAIPAISLTCQSSQLILSCCFHLHSLKTCVIVPGDMNPLCGHSTALLTAPDCLWMCCIWYEACHMCWHCRC